MVYAFWHVEESKWVTLNLADVQKRRDRLKVRPTHESLDDIREEMRWEELSWDKVRRAQMRRSVGVKSAVWSVGREECSVKFGVWRKQWEVRSVDCEVWTVKCEMWSVECEVWSVDWEECSVKWEVWSVHCGVWRVQGEVWSAKWSFKCDFLRVHARTGLAGARRMQVL